MEVVLSCAIFIVALKAVLPEMSGQYGCLHRISLIFCIDPVENLK